MAEQLGCRVVPDDRPTRGEIEAARDILQGILDRGVSRSDTQAAYVIGALAAIKWVLGEGSQPDPGA